MTDDATKANESAVQAGSAGAAAFTIPRPDRPPSFPPSKVSAAETSLTSAAVPPKPPARVPSVPPALVAMTPMRIIEVKGGGSGPPPPLPSPEATLPDASTESPASRPVYGSDGEAIDAGPSSLSSPDAPTPPETPALRRAVLVARGELPAVDISVAIDDDDEDESAFAAPAPDQSVTEAPAEPGPPPVPAVVDLDSPPRYGDQLESIPEEELTEVNETESAVAVPPRKKRRSLPPRPPPRSTFSDVEERRKVWWEEMFGDDFPRANYEAGPGQVKRELEFIQASLGLKPGGTLLDLACGDGAVSVGMAERGYQVSGVDISVDQLARARELAIQAQQKVEFKQGDMRESLGENAFDALLCWNASFGYFEEEKNLAVLKNVYGALKPGGAFLLDVPNRDFVVEQQPSQNWFEGDGCVCMDDMHMDFFTSRLCVKRTVMLDDGRNREWTYSMRVYGLHELGAILHNLGFHVTQVSGQISTPGVFFGAKAPQLIVLATKPL